MAKINWKRLYEVAAASKEGNDLFNKLISAIQTLDRKINVLYIGEVTENTVYEKRVSVEKQEMNIAHLCGALSSYLIRLNDMSERISGKKDILPKYLDRNDLRQTLKVVRSYNQFLEKERNEVVKHYLGTHPEICLKKTKPAKKKSS